jgi:hypothetical protein
VGWWGRGAGGGSGEGSPGRLASGAASPDARAGCLNSPSLVEAVWVRLASGTASLDARRVHD